ncbi:MAG: hypothetical protein WDN04_12155 [Rhodospirillales bacterium]
MIRGSVLGIGIGVAVGCGAVAAPVGAASRAFEGAWIWDPAQYVAPFGAQPGVAMARETLLVAHDDGRHWAARIEQVYTDGRALTYAEDFPEDGELHRAGRGADAMMVAVAAMGDGGRRMISYRFGNIHDGTCYVSGGGMTLSCSGTDKQPDGTAGRFLCVYHRDPYTVPVEVAPVAP